MKFEVVLSDNAKSDIEKLKKSGNKKVLRKIYDLLKELEDNPEFGTGKPEQLKHYTEPTGHEEFQESIV